MAAVAFGPGEAALYWRYIDQAHSRERQARLAAHDPAGELWQNYEMITARVNGGGRDAADAVVLLADSASSREQVAFLVAGPFEDLFHADAEAFYAHVLPRVSASVVGSAVDGMVVPSDATARIAAFAGSGRPSRRRVEGSGTAPACPRPSSSALG